MNIEQFCYDGTRHFFPERCDPSFHKNYACREDATQKLTQNLQTLNRLQERLYAQNREAMLVIFQAMDAAGKDGTIKYVLSGMNPQGIDVWNFRQPSTEELDHDYLWRCVRRLPERGKLCIFNRSYYEEVLVSRVHKLYQTQNLPDRCLYRNLIDRRYRQIRDFERYLWENGIRTVKIYLNISYEEQRRRLLRRIDNPAKNWKFSDSDIREREHWPEYADAYRDAINATACRHSPWFVVPANKKWYAHLVVSEILVQTLERMEPQYPKLPEEKAAQLEHCRKILLAEQEKQPS